VAPRRTSAISHGDWYPSFLDSLYCKPRPIDQILLHRLGIWISILRDNIASGSISTRKHRVSKQRDSWPWKNHFPFCPFSRR
jgi:hypothetical protein